MRKASSLAPALIFVMLLNAAGQVPRQPPPQRQTTTELPGVTPRPRQTPTPPTQLQVVGEDDEDEVVRITSKLVQVDAVVTDKDGKQITDLQPEDFEVTENGKPQEITNFSYVKIEGTRPAAPGPAPSTERPRNREAVARSVPPARLRPEQVGRTIALVIDDLWMSAESAGDARRALRKYIDEQVQPGDLVAIIRTSSGVGALQQFTNDRRQLYAAAERVRWRARVGGQTALPSFNTLDMTANSMSSGSNNPSRLPSLPDSARVGLKEIEEMRRQGYTVGTLGALSTVVQGMRELPGRKAVILFSDGFPLLDARGESVTYISFIHRLIDYANRASVVFYTVDSRGLQPLGPFASDDTAGRPPGAGGGLSGAGGVGIGPTQIGQRVLSVRGGQIFEGQAGLSLLAQSTGGQALLNSNDLNRGIRRALDDMSGYYLIGYRPAEETFDPETGRRRFNTLTVSVRNRPGLKVRSRTGFLPVADDAPRARPATRIGQLHAALVSPFSAGGINLRLTSLFANAPGAGSFMRSLLLIDPRNLSFKQQPDGQYQAVMDILAVTVGEKWEVIDQLNRVETIRVRPEAYERFQREGMVYDLNVPVKKPGAYQLRVAVRDAATERVGSASQYVVVPDLSNNRLELSGIVVSGSYPQGRGTPDAEIDPGVRRLKRGGVLDYGYVVYNARLDRGTRRPQLTVQAVLLRDGKQIFATTPQPFDPGQQTDMTRLPVAGRLQLGTDMAPGEYVLQVVVSDTLGGSPRTATQYIDFEVVQ